MLTILTSNGLSATQYDNACFVLYRYFFGDTCMGDSIAFLSGALKHQSLLPAI